MTSFSFCQSDSSRLLIGWYVLALGQRWVDGLSNEALRGVGPWSSALSSLGLYSLLVLWLAFAVELLCGRRRIRYLAGSVGSDASGSSVGVPMAIIGPVHPSLTSQPPNATKRSSIRTAPAVR